MVCYMLSSHSLDLILLLSSLGYAWNVTHFQTEYSHKWGVALQQKTEGASHISEPSNLMRVRLLLL